jgi:hypothetical protein|nr:MAG TPA: tail-collar fiber protein [Caudoviricetes sp.]
MPSQYPQNVVTKKGLAMIAESVATKKNLIFTRVVVGDGDATGRNFNDMSAVISPKMELPVTSGVNEGNGQYLVTATLSNNKLDVGFFPREVGLYAKVDGKTEQLYSYTNGGNNVGYVPDKTSPIDSEIYKIRTVIGNAKNITINMNNSTFLTRGELDNHNNDKNAHAELLKLFLRLTGGTLTGDLNIINSYFGFKTNDSGYSTKIRLASNGNFDIGVTEDTNNKNATAQLMLHSQNRPKWYNSSIGGKELATMEELLPINNLLGQGGIVASKLDGQNGFVKFANGFTIQFGRANITANTSQVNIVLPIRCNTIFACSANDIGIGAYPLGIDGDQTQITVHRQLKEENTQVFIKFYWIVLSK